MANLIIRAKMREKKHLPVTYLTVLCERENLTETLTTAENNKDIESYVVLLVGGFSPSLTPVQCDYSEEEAKQFPKWKPKIEATNAIWLCSGQSSTGFEAYKEFTTVAGLMENLAIPNKNTPAHKGYSLFGDKLYAFYDLSHYAPTGYQGIRRQRYLLGTVELPELILQSELDAYYEASPKKNY